ncbi:hypothetical protein ZWY2020_038953 [Hordeum vulgare]|nr:hypothetical protein ZWY2020_038953 [Hordeum vulgare]
MCRRCAYLELAAAEGYDGAESWPTPQRPGDGCPAAEARRLPVVGAPTGRSRAEGHGNGGSSGEASSGGRGEG